MCGKLRAHLSWSDVHDLSQIIGGPRPGRIGDDEDIEEDGPSEDGDNDPVVQYGVTGLLPVIVWDREEGKRKVVRMRWGFPHPQDWRRPQPIHARAETVDTRTPFRAPFRSGRRGIVIFKTFNEGEEVATRTGGTRTVQHIIDPMDGLPRGFAFVWDRFNVAGLDIPLLTCVMVTVPANALLRDGILRNQDDPRMPAILAEADWTPWLGENDPAAGDAKAALKTVEGVSWDVRPEPKKPRSR